MAVLAAVAVVMVLVSTGRRSPSVGAPARLCVDPGSGPDGMARLSALVGADVSCAMVFANAAATWADWEHPYFVAARNPALRWPEWLHAAPGRQLIVTLSMVPSDAPADWRSLGAAGAYRDHASALGRALVAAGLSRVVLRLGPEANNEADPAARSDTSVGSTPADIGDWRAYWANIAAALKAVPGAHFVLDWTVNAGYRPLPFGEYYPGDQAVDVIGVDAYDTLVDGSAVPAGSRRWQAVDGQPYGLAAVAAFARARHKPLSVPEWGLVAPSSGGAGDDPAYVHAMAALFRSGRVAYQSYFNATTGGVLTLVEVPRSLDTYRREVVG